MRMLRCTATLTLMSASRSPLMLSALLGGVNGTWFSSLACLGSPRRLVLMLPLRFPDLVTRLRMLPWTNGPGMLRPLSSSPVVKPPVIESAWSVWISLAWMMSGVSSDPASLSTSMVWIVCAYSVVSVAMIVP